MILEIASRPFSIDIQADGRAGCLFNNKTT